MEFEGHGLYDTSIITITYFMVADLWLEVPLKC